MQRAYVTKAAGGLGVRAPAQGSQACVYVHVIRARTTQTHLRQAGRPDYTSLRPMPEFTKLPHLPCLIPSAFDA